MSQVARAQRQVRTWVATLVIVTGLGACGGSGMGNYPHQQLEAAGYSVVAVVQDPAASYAVHYLYER